MKQIKLIAAFAVMALLLASCGKKNDYKAFVGTWGVEKIEYYNIDYACNPIPATIETYNFNPDNINDGIQLIFREDKSGEMRDKSRDTLYFDFDTVTNTYQTIIVCPDTTLVTKFTYSYDNSQSILYMNMDYVRTFMMHVYNLESNSFTYENEYGKDYVERAYLKRLSSDKSSKAIEKSKEVRPRKLESFLSGK